jgi:hypothetical protein
VFDAAGPTGRQARDLIVPLTVVLLVLHVLEIAERRLSLTTGKRLYYGSGPASWRLVTC